MRGREILGGRTKPDVTQIDLYMVPRCPTIKRVLLNTGSPGLDKEKVAGRMIFGRRSGVKIIREAAFDAV
jgi:hypothetical protein